jgi:hypothetical protein
MVIFTFRSDLPVISVMRKAHLEWPRRAGKAMTRSLFLLVLFLIVSVAPADAACVERTKNLEVSAESAKPIKGYTCTTQPGGPELKAEIFNVSGVAAGIVLGLSPRTSLLDKVLGNYHLVDNQISELYGGFFKKFSRAFAIQPGGEGASLFTTIADDVQSAGDKYDQYDSLKNSKKIRAIVVDPNVVFEYPAFDLTASLKKKMLPTGYRFYYGETCQEYSDTGEECLKATPSMIVWRPMQVSDLKDYLKKLGKRASEAKKDTGAIFDVAKVDSYLKFIEELGLRELPVDFLTMQLERGADECDGSVGTSFTVQPRDMALRIALITNLSNKPILVDAILGNLTQTSDLRDANSAESSTGAPIDIGAQTIAPAQSILIPLQIRFPGPANLDKKAVEVSNTWFAKRGADDLKADSSAYALPPRANDYAYGPEIRVAGVRADGIDIEFAPRSANFIEVVAAYEAGSCPYLLTWDGVDREWVEQGKILHDARGVQRMGTQLVTFTNFQSRFRLEEREPERVSLDEVGLELTLRNGRLEFLPASLPALAKRDETYLQLFWGDAVEFVFTLPRGIDESDIVRSRLRVVGFYERYAAMTAETGIGIPDRGKTRTLPEMCPATALKTPR